MNTPKINGLYRASKYALFHQGAARHPQAERQQTLTELENHLRRIVYNEFLADNELAFKVSVRDTKPVSGKRDFFGEKQYELVNTYCPPRVYAWAQRQLPAADNYEVDRKDRQMASVGTRQQEEWELTVRVGGEADFAVLLRGMLSFARKRQKYARKIMAQLAAYHRQQLVQQLAKEVRDLQAGQWLGADKALTTAARTDEPGVAFLGDAALSDEQRRALGLAYWAVPAEAGMSAAFPTGTGLALKRITSGKQLVDGAVYLSQISFGKPGDAHYHPCMRLGRLDMSRKERGRIPLFWDDEPARDLYVQAEWRQPREGQGYEVKLFQVVYYTTRAAEQLAEVPVRALTPLRRARSRKQLALAA